MVFGLFNGGKRTPLPSAPPPPRPDADPGGLLPLVDHIRTLPFIVNATMLFDLPMPYFNPWPNSEPSLYLPQRRDDPRGVAAMFAAFSDSVRWERHRRGYQSRSPVNDPIDPEITADGFVIERIPGDDVETVIYAVDLAAMPVNEYLEPGLKMLGFECDRLPAWIGRKETVQAHEAGLLRSSCYWQGQTAAFFLKTEHEQAGPRHIWHPGNFAGRKELMPLFALRLESVTVPLAAPSNPGSVDWDLPEEWR